MKKGFTLAEVLITLGIVGIIAAMTVPAVMKNYKNKVYVAQLQKVYSQVADAARSIMNDENTDNFYSTTAGTKNSCSNPDAGICEAGAGYFLNKYFKVIKKNCGIVGSPNANSCVIPRYKSIDGRDADTVGGDYCVQTTNGASICMVLSKRSSTTTAQPLRSFINVDINGVAEPNITGRDVFYFEILPNGVVEDHSKNENDCSNPNSGGCLTKIINDGWKMNY